MKILAVNYSLQSHGIPVEEEFITTRKRPFSHESGIRAGGVVKNFSRLLGAALRADFDVAVVLANGHGSMPGRLRRLKRIGWLLNSILTEALLRIALRDRTKKLAVLDLGDMRWVTPRDRWLLDRSTVFFKRELADNVMGSLEMVLPWGMHIGDACKLPKLHAWARKMRPISLGIPGMPAIAPPVEKKHDIFYACNDWEIHKVRIDVREFLERARENYGYRIYMPEKRLPKAEFERAIAESRICISPSGGGWDCFRHYEVPACESVVMMDMPTIVPYRPFRHGESAFYFRDMDDLEALLAELLASPERLDQVSRDGKAHVEKWHTYPRLKQYIFEELGGTADDKLVSGDTVGE